MEVTRVSIRPEIKEKSRLRGYATIVLDDEFVIRYLRIIEGKNGLFVVYPSKENSRICTKCKSRISYRDTFCRSCGTSVTAFLAEAKYKDIAFPIKSTLADKIEAAVLEKYTQSVQLSETTKKE